MWLSALKWTNSGATSALNHASAGCFTRMTGYGGRLWRTYSVNARWPRWSVFWACSRPLRSWYGWRMAGRFTFEKPPCKAGFFVYRARDYDEAEWISRFHLACHPIIQSFGVVLTRSPWFVTYPPQGISFFIFLMICTKSVVRNNLSSLNKHTHKQWLCFISLQ